MSKPTVYTDVFLEYAEDGFRWRIGECDGIFQIEYQEYVDKDGKLEPIAGKGEWRKKDSFEGLWCSDVDAICDALKAVAERAGRES